MDWLNIHRPWLRAPEFIGSEPAARAAWLMVLGYCCEQENGGRLKGAAAWKDRQWQQLCGVTLPEIQDSAPLLIFDGEDVVVWNYPVEKEEEVKARREAGARGGLAKAANRQKQTPSSATSGATGTPIRSAPTEGEGEGEGERKEKELPPNPQGGIGGEEKPEPKEAKNIPTTETALRFAAIFHRKPSTPWTDKEVKAYKRLGTIDEQSLMDVESYYAVNYPPREGNFLRRDLLTFLNNFQGEVDRARNWRQSAPQPPLSLDKADHPQWSAFLHSLNRKYQRQQYAPEYLRDEFTTWKKQNPETAK